MVIPARFGPELAYCSRELARIRAEVVRADVQGLAQGAVYRDSAAVIRACSYVWLASTLERTVRESLRTTVREIGALGLSSRSLRTSLFALLCDAEFASISDSGRGKSWTTKVDLLARVTDSSPANMSEEVLPLDGRTIRGDHFETIWKVFGLPGPSLPSPRHRVALRDLADGRNEVAHGHLDPVAFGRSKATADVLGLVALVDEIIAHMLSSLDAYLTGNEFCR